MDEQTPTDRTAEYEVDLSDSSANFAEMLMANLSLGGCFIRTNVPEPPGAMVMLRFELPGSDGNASVRAVGRVCWVRDGSTGPAGMGLQFTRVDDEDLLELSNYVAGLLDSDVAPIAEEAA